MINFNYVKFKNFGSFGNYFTEVNFHDNQMTLVSGSNGHGKSYALLDSITFALFGKPFRKINIPQLVNTINNKDCLVEVEFKTNGFTYKVIRGLKPKKFEVYKDNELIKQSAKAKDYQRMLEEQILKMNYKSFTQIVTLGSSSFIPFMQLSPADRREVIEDILDINIFSTMNFIVKAKMSNIKELLLKKTKDIEILKEKIKLQESNIISLQKKVNQNISNNTKKIKEVQNEISNLLLDIDSLEKSILHLEETESKKKENETRIAKLEKKIITAIKDKKSLTQNLKFYDDHETCSVCNQGIDHEFKNKKQNELKEQIEELSSIVDENKNVFYTLKQEVEGLDEIIEKCNDVTLKIRENKNSISAANKYMSSLQTDGNQEDILEENIKEAELAKENYNRELEKLNASLEEVKDLKNNLNILSILLKDSGIKSKIIKNYLPAINETINKYLNDMNFFASFTLDEEFNEHIKSRHRDTFSYMNFSEGEKSRIDLAILLAWREIARLKNSAHTNLLILDEIFDSSMDSVGVDDLMKVLRKLSINTNIFVITHKSDQLADRFDRGISFKKKNNFSRLVKK